MHVLGTRVLRCLSVARSTSCPKAAQALGCSLTPGLRISFGRVTCMARAASVPRLWTLGFLLLRGTCVWVSVVVGFGFRLRPATPGWGVGVCVCFGPVPLVPRHLWLGCAAWVCVLGLGFRLRPATPGWGVGVCVCLCARSTCTPPLLAGVCGVGVCVWARVSAAPRHSWLGWWGVCVLVCVLPLYPATPGWGVRFLCVCLGWGFGCAPPLLAEVLGCACLCACSPCTLPLLAGARGVGVCVWVRVSAAPRHSWLGCWGVCVPVCVLRLYPATPSWGVRCGCGCLGWGLGCAPPVLAGVLGCACLCACSPCSPLLLAGVCGVGVCAWARDSAAPRHSWLGCWGVCVLVCALCLCPATPGSGVRCWCVRLGSGFGCAPPLLAGVLGCACFCACSRCTPPLVAGARGVGVCVCARVSAAPRHSWLGCWGVCVLVCLSACTPPLVAGVCGVGVCAWARDSAAPRHSWLGCWGVCVLVFALRLYPATPGWGVRRGCVCLGSGFGCAPPLLPGVLGCVCAGVRAPLVPRHSWLGCAVWVCVFGLGFRLRPATLGWGVGVCVFVCVLPLYPASPGWGARRGCVCLGSGFGCAPPLLAGVLGRVCAGVGAPLVPRHSWLGCAVCVCVFGLGFRLRPATSGWGVGVCVLVCVLPLYPATPGWGVRRGCVCLGTGFDCAPPLLAGVLGFVCAGVRAPLGPCHSWLGCAVLVCVFGVGFRLRPASPGWGVGVCVCLCACSACTPPLLAGVFRRGCVCSGSGFGCAPPLLAGVLGFASVGFRAPLVPRHSWLGCAAWVCAGVRASPVPRHSSLGCALSVCVLGLRFWLRSATPGWGLWCVGWLLPGTCSCAVVRCVLCALPGFAAPGGRCGLAPVLVPWLWPAACLSGVPRGPSLVRRASSGPVALGAPVGFSCCRGAFPNPGGLRPRLYWVAARGTRRPAENRAHCACRWPPPRQGRWARSASYLFGAPRLVCPWGLPQASVLGCVRCGVLRVWTRSLTRPASRTVSLSTGDSAGAPGLFRVDADTTAFGSEDATPGSCACVRVRAFLAGSGGPASRARFGAPHLFLWPFLLLSFSARPPPGWGCPACVFPGFFSPLVRSPCLRRSVFSGPGCLGPWRLVVLPPPSLFFFFLPPPLRVCLFLLFSFSGFLLFFFLPFFSCCAGCAVPGWCVVVGGACWCVFLWALCSVVRCPLPVPPLFVLLHVVFRGPVGAVLAALLFPLLPCGVARPTPLALGAGFIFVFFASGLCWLSPPPPFGGWLRSPVLWCVVRCVVWCCGLWCVLCCVRCCVACLRSCAVLCWVVLCCCCCALLSCVAAFSACFFFFCVVPCLSVVLRAVCVSVLCLCGALLVCLRGCSLCAALLPLRRWLVFCVVVCCVLLGPAVLCCLLVGPGGSSCRLSVVCSGVSLGAVLRCVAARCAARRCVVLFCSVWCCRVVCPVAVRRPGVLCLPVLCFVVSRRAVCVLLWCIVAWCCSPMCFVPCASRGVVLCVPCPLLPVRCCCGALLSLGALLPCAVPRGAVLPCGGVVSHPAALFGLFDAFVLFVLLEKPLQNWLKYFFSFFENKIKLYTTQRTQTRTLAGSNTMSGSLPYMLPRVGGSVVAGMPWWSRCPGLDAAYVPPAAKGRRKRRGWGTGGRGRHMVNKRGRAGRVQGRGVL